MSKPTLRDVLGGFEPAGSPSSEVRCRREHLASFVRSVQSRVFEATASTRIKLWRLLGWDDDSLDAFIRSPMIVHSSTHVSMNAFPPMMTFPWFCLQMANSAGERPVGTPAVHLRTQVTHNNLSDSRWKPNIWWRVTDGGELARTRLFSQASRYKHQVLLCQPVPECPADLCESDAEAVDLASHATNFAYFAMIYRMALERRADLHTPNGVVEIPVDLMNVYSLADDAAGAWGRAMAEMGLTLRGIGSDNKLHERPELHGDLLMEAVDPLDVRATLVCPNYLNVGQAYRLGISVTMGAEKMSMYLAEMNDVIIEFLARIGETCRIPRFLGVSQIDIDRLAPLPGAWPAQIARQRGKSSLSLLVAYHGATLRHKLDEALDQAVEEVASVVVML